MKLWVLDFHTGTLSYVSDSLFHEKCLFFHQEYCIDSSVFINMLTRKQILHLGVSVRVIVLHVQ